MSGHIEQRSDEWFAQRVGKITASRVGAILGNSPFMKRSDVMRSMIREALGAESEFIGNVATEYGNNNEDGALIDYRIETTHDVESVGFITREDWAGASPDGLINDHGGVEIKCPFSLRKADAPVAFKSIADQPHYADQVQFTLWVTSRKFWHFFQWCPAGTKLEVVYPDKDWQDHNLPILRQFYAEYLDELANNADEHLRPKRVTIDTPDAHRMVLEFDELNEQIERATNRKKELIADMVKVAGGADALFAGRKLTLTKRAGSISYAKAIKELAPKADLEKWRGNAVNYWSLN